MGIDRSVGCWLNASEGMAFKCAAMQECGTAVELLLMYPNPNPIPPIRHRHILIDNAMLRTLVTAAVVGAGLLLPG